jgi:hypothetical protein
MNKDLYGNSVNLPEDVLKYLGDCFNSALGADDSTEGFRRNKELRDKGTVSYQQLKRMKNWFDSFNGHQNDLPFILNGGDYVKNWVNNTLTSMRGDISLSKDIKSVALDNQYISPHEKNNVVNQNRPSKDHHSNLERYDLEITESLKRINDIIKKII